MLNRRSFIGTSARNVVITLLLSVTLVSQAAFVGGCNGPTTKQLQVTAEAAKDIGGGTRDVIKAVGDAYHKGLITLTQKDRYADLLGRIARGGQKGVDAIDALFKSGITDLPADQALALNKLFSAEVIDPFLSLLSEFASLSANASAVIQASISSLKTIILLVSQKIGRVDVINQINERWAYGED